MATELNANGVSFGGPIYNQQGSDTAANTYSRNAPVIVKIGFGSDKVSKIIRLKQKIRKFLRYS